MALVNETSALITLRRNYAGELLPIFCFLSSKDTTRIQPSVIQNTGPHHTTGLPGPDCTLPVPKTMKNKFWFFKPPSLWHSVSLI